MAGSQAFGSNGKSDSQGGLLGASLLESAILSTSLEDNSAYLGLSQALKTGVGSDPLTSQINSLTNYNNSPLTSNQSLTTDTPNFLNTPESLRSDSKDPLTGTTKNTSLVSTSKNDPLTGNQSLNSSQVNTPLPAPLPKYAIRSGGTVTVNGSSDFDGEPLDLSDDALIYGAKGFTINGNSALPIQRDGAGNPIKDAKGLSLLVDKAVAVSTGYSVSNGPSNKYAGLLPPQVIEPQTIVIPAYSDILERELLRRTPTSATTVTFNAAINPINNAAQWASKFPAPGTASDPTLVRVTGGSLTIPSNVNLSNYIITVDSGDINFNGSNHNVNNAVLVVKSGNINLANVQASNVSMFASGSINTNGGARFAGNSLLANSSGNINFNGATKTTSTSDSLTVISQGSITYNGASTTRGTFLSGKDFTFNGKSTLYGSISAKGNILFNGNATVIADFADPTPPTISATLVWDTAPNGITNTDKITFDSAIKGTVTDASIVTGFRAGFDSTSASNFISVIPQLAKDGSFNLTSAQLAQIAGGTLTDGVHTLHLQAQDLHGNVSPVFDFTFTLDSTLPLVNLTTPVDTAPLTPQSHLTGIVDGTGSAVAQINYHFDNLKSVEIAIDATGAFDQLLDFKGITNGLHLLTITTTDLAGNVKENAYNVTVRLDLAPPVINAALVRDTAPGNTTNSDRITSDPTISGTVTDASTVTSLKAGFNDTAIGNFVDVLPYRNTDGSFTFDRQQLETIYGASLSDGLYTLHLVAQDEYGNNCEVFDFTFTLDTTAPVANFDLAPDFDSQPLGDKETTFDLVTLSGETEKDASLVLQQTGSVVTADATGQFEFSDVDFALGQNEIFVQVTDIAGNQSIATETFLRLNPGDFDSGLTQWTVFETGGSEAIRGSVTSSLGDVTIIEGDSFTVGLERTLEISSSASVLTFNYADLNFDNADTDINDAFEVALVDETGRSLVHTISSTSDAFFNITEDEPVDLGAGTTISGSTVTVNLSELIIGSNAKLIFRLVNDDSDVNTSVRIQDVQFLSESGGVIADVVTPTTNTATGIIDFSRLEDVSSSMSAEYGQTSFNQDTSILLAELAVVNTGSFLVRDSLLVGVTNLSDPTVQVLRTDGITPDGIKYYDYSNLVTGGILSVDERTFGQNLAFYNPQGTQFTYDLVFFSQLNQSPTFVTNQDEEALIGRAYVYDTLASDLDGDLLTYSILSAPEGMVIDSATGQITWNPISSDLGTHSVTVRVTDGQGGEAEQQYVLSAITPPPNRPPVFTSTPIVDANINTGYTYAATATDVDGEPLTFSLVGAPLGMTIDAGTGLVIWTPSGSQLGTYDVTLSVNDGHGDTAQQSFRIQTQMEPGNRAPIIISEPNPQFSILRTSIPQVTGGQIVVSSPDLASIHGQKFLDVNGNGVWNKTGSPVELVPSGPVILTRNDDGSTAKLPLGFTFNFFGQSFTDFYINNNGNVTFNGPLGAYSSSGFPVSNFPIVAPFWADVDTRGGTSGQVHLAKGTTASGNSFAQIDWPDVGYYPGQVDKLNDFTLYIEDGGAEDLIVFAYRNMQWTTGSASGGSSGFGGVPAQIGFNAGDGVNFVSLGRPSSAANLVPFTDTQYVFKSTSTSRPKLFGEPGLDGITVELVNSSTGSVVATQVTQTLDLNGNGEIDPVTEQGLYRFENLASGNYIVREQQRDGWIQTSPTPTTYTATLNSGTRIENLDFGNAKTYFYPAQAIDPDGDTLTYDLLTAPTGATIDAQTGRLNWFPTSAGSYHFLLSVDDGQGGQSNQEFDIIVQDNDPNAAPIITSTAPVRAAIGQTYTYQVTAADSNYDSLLFDLRQAPSGMSINALTGIISWTPTETQIGSQTVILRVQDGRGGQALQTLNISVVSTLVNQPPEFTTTPQNNGAVGQLYQYTAKANDPDIDILSFDLVVKPDGMTVDSATGKIFWIPTTEQLGSHSVILRVQDGRGGIALQEIEISIDNANIGPLFTSEPNLQGVTDLLYQYQVRANDPEGDTLSFRLNSAPEGMGIDAMTGLLAWQPNASQTGRHTVAITVSDSTGGETAQLFEITVLATAPPNELPVITSQPRHQIALGQSYFYSVQATDPNVDPLTYSLDNAPVGMTINSSGRLLWTPQANQLGSNAVTVQVSDSRGGVVTQIFDIDVVSTTLLVNQLPNITSTPALSATINNSYQYNLTATDADNDSLAWGLDEAPSGMVIDPTTGVLRWNPTSNQLGENLVTVRVVDSLGGFTIQSFTLYARSQNTPSTITSTPGTQAAVNKLYTYAIAASDAESNALNYRLTVAPSGMVINATTGLIQWIPTSTQAGSQVVTIAVDDGNGSTTTQSYHLVTSITATNLAPGITSQPVYAASVGQPYSYQVTATDPEGGVLSYSLQGAPTGMTIDSTTGLVQWNPNVNQVGTFAVKVIATDSQGASGGQGFTLNTIINRAPIILSMPVSAATIGQSYRYDIKAIDPDGDALSYSLESAPLGMTIDSRGRIVWNPQNSDVGDYSIVLSIKDSRGGMVSQGYSLSVAADTQAPKVSLTANWNAVNPGNQVTFTAIATDNVKVAGLQLIVNDTPVILDANGRATVTLSQPGTVVARAIAFDSAGNTGNATTSVLVLDPADISAPTIDLNLSAIANSTITAPTDIIGTVADTNLDYYTLEVALLGSNDFTEVFRGTTSVTNGVLGEFDPTLLSNDTYTLRLTAYDTNGQGSITEDTISVAGELKLGNFRLSFTDLSIPVTGIPITLTRTYDTLTSNATDDFGYGWRLEFRDTDLRTSVAAPDSLQQELGYYNPFSDGTRVYITLPGGQRQGFTFKPEQDILNSYLRGAAANAGLSGDPGLYHPAFVADKGVTSTLTVRDSYIIHGGDSGQYYGMAGVAYNPADSYFGSIYVLTTKDGIVYEIDGQTGDLLTVTDANGNKLTYTDADITSSTGQKVTFGRDAQARITSVTDPMGNKITYKYDAVGDLVSVSDRSGNTTQFVYDDTHPHYLEEIIDPLGRIGVKNEYDDQGRLVKMVDVNGNAVELIHDPSNSVETVKDTLGNATTYEYDVRGNVVTEVDALGGVTRNTYNDNNYLLSQTNPEGETTSYTYDSKGNQTSVTDPLGNITRYSYNSLSQVLTETDPLGNTTKNVYSPKGNLRSTTDAEGSTTNFGYDLRGQLLSVSDAMGNLTKFQYDNYGHIVGLIDALGNATTYTYDLNGNFLAETITVDTSTGSRTITTNRTYDAQGRVASVTDAENQTTRYEYDKLGNQIAVVDANGRRTQYRYDERGQLVETIYPDATPIDLTDNLRTSTQYDVLGRTIASIDAADRITYYTYDGNSQLIEIIYPDATPINLTDNPKTRTEYDKAGRVIASINERGNRTQYKYYANGQQIEIIYADNTPTDLTDNPTTTFTHDNIGRQIATTDALNQTTSYVYDDLGRIEEVHFHDGTYTTTTYDVLGRRIAITDAGGKTTQYRYDELSRLTGVENALGDWTEYGYNSVSSLLWIEDANNHRTNYEYDDVGRRTATILPLGQRSTTTYDGVSNLLTQTDFNGDTTNHEYDELNRLVRKTFPDSTATTFAYTLNGQIASVTDQRGTITYTYDERDRLLSRTDPDGRAISYTYDAASNRTSVTTASGTTRYTFDVRNWLDTVIDPNLGVTNYDYNAVGNLTQTTLPNGAQEVRQYDDLNRLVYLENAKATGEIISSYTYILDSVGNRQVVKENTGRIVEYIYDDLYRLTSEDIADSINGDLINTYTYDKVGNRLSKVDSIAGQTNYSYDDNDRLLTTTLNGTSSQYTYDDNGNTITYSSPTEQTFYEWNYENRLISAEVMDATGTRLMQYSYDANGIRVASMVDGEETRYLVDTNQPYAQVLEEYSAGGTVMVSYVYGNDLISQQQDNITTFYHVDGLGSTVALTNASGNVVSTYSYKAFGELLNQTGNLDNKYLFAGEQYDSNLGDYYLRDRYYDSDTGRFTRRDSYLGNVLEPITFHKYIYANANPVTGTDPSGLFTLTELSFVSQEIGRQAAISYTTTNFILQAAQITAGFLTLAAGVVVGSYILEETKKGNNKVDYKIYPEDPNQRKAINNKLDDAYQMRVQLQYKKEHDHGIALIAAKEIGVTKTQVYSGLLELWQTHGSAASWFPSSQDRNLYRGIVEVSKEVRDRVGPTEMGRQQVASSQWMADGRQLTRSDYRVDVENLRGENLRY